MDVKMELRTPHDPELCDPQLSSSIVTRYEEHPGRRAEASSLAWRGDPS